MTAVWGMTEMPMDAETKRALEKVRDDMAIISVQGELNKRGLEDLSRQFREHDAKCAANSEAIALIAQGVSEMKMSLLWANRVRRFVIWVTPVAAVFAGTFEYLKGRF